MHFLTVSAFVAISLPLASSKSLYVDSTCTGKAGWNDFFSETINFAKLASQRMSSGSDTDFKNVFNRIMKTDVGSTEGQFVKSTIDQIAGLSQTDDLGGSDIRLFCDDDKRWVQKQKGWYDQTNELVDRDVPSCHETDDQGRKKVLGRNYERKARGKPGQNDNRVVVTICDLAFTLPGINDVPASLGDSRIKDEQDFLTDTKVEYLSGLVSATVLHELAHAVSVSNEKYDIRDLPDKTTAYGWDNVFPNDAATAIKNADNYAYLGIWAGLADLGYTLTRITTDDPAVKAALEGYVEEGKLKKYVDITKRALIMIAKRFTA